MRFTLSLLGIAFAALLPACGGGSGTDDQQMDPNAQSVLINYDTMAGAGSDLTTRIGGPTQFVGDTLDNEARIIVLEFDFGGIPGNATIVDAILRITFHSKTGDAASKLGLLRAERIFWEENRLGQSYGIPTLAHDPTADLSGDLIAPRTEISVKVLVESARAAGDGGLRMRLAYEVPLVSDGVQDAFIAATKIDSSREPPRLEVFYTTP